MIELTPDALEKLAEVARFVKKEAGSFRMDVPATLDAGSSCGTAACAAGTLVHLFWKKGPRSRELATFNWSTISQRAGKILGIDSKLAHGFPLFHVEQWPMPYRERYQIFGDFVIEGVDTEATREREIIKARAANAEAFSELVGEIISRGGIWWMDREEALTFG